MHTKAQRFQFAPIHLPFQVGYISTAKSSNGANVQFNGPKFMEDALDQMRNDIFEALLEFKGEVTQNRGKLRKAYLDNRKIWKLEEL